MAVKLAIRSRLQSQTILYWFKGLNSLKNYRNCHGETSRIEVMHLFIKQKKTKKNKTHPNKNNYFMPIYFLMIYRITQYALYHHEHF